MKFFIYLILFSLFLSSSLNYTEYWEFPSSVIYLLLCLFLVFQLFKYREKVHFDYKSLITIYLFILFSGISSFINSDIQLLISSLVIFLLYYTSFSILPSLSKVNINELIYRSIVISHILIIIIPILLYGFDSDPYRSIFHNPNTLGGMVATLFAVILSTFLFDIEKFIINSKNGKITFPRIFFNILILFGLMYLAVLSGSRASLLALIIVFLISLTYLIIYLIKVKKIVSFISKGALLMGIVTLVIASLLKFTQFNDFLYFNIIYKFERKSAEGDVLDQRGDVWLQTIEEASLFGNGSSYFSSSFDIGAHNTFINILGRLGWAPFIMFVILLIILIIYSIKHTLKNSDDKYKYMPLTLCVCFLMLSMTELMLFKLSMLGMFLSIGAIQISYKKNKSYIT